jgi:hypothetical protein
MLMYILINHIRKDLLLQVGYFKFVCIEGIKFKWEITIELILMFQRVAPPLQQSNFCV